MGFLTTGNNFTTGDSVTAAKLNNAINNATLTGALSPAADDTYDLGAGATEFKDLYLDGVAYLDDISLTTARTTTDAFDMNLDTLTTGKGVDITADALTTGGVIYIDSNSAETDARNLVEIINNNALATGAVPLKVQNDSTSSALSVQAAGNGAHLLLTGDPTVASPTDGGLWFTGSALNFRNGTSTLDLLTTQMKIGTFTRDCTAASGDVEYTGVGFVPRYIIFVGSGITPHQTIGFDDATSHYSIAVQNDGATVIDSAHSINYREADADAQQAIVKTFDADGFTLTWAKNVNGVTGTATVYYMAVR